MEWYVDLGVSRLKSTRVDLRLPSRVESILLTSTTGFVDLSRFCFKSTWKRLNALLSLLSSILSVKQKETIIDERNAWSSRRQTSMWIGNWSHIATHLIVIGPTLFKKTFIHWNRIGKKFGKIVLQVNTRRVFGLTSYFQDIGHEVRPPFTVAYASVSAGFTIARRERLSLTSLARCSLCATILDPLCVLFC